MKINITKLELVGIFFYNVNSALNFPESEPINSFKMKLTFQMLDKLRLNIIKTILKTYSM